MYFDHRPITGSIAGLIRLTALLLAAAGASAQDAGRAKAFVESSARESFEVAAAAAGIAIESQKDPYRAKLDSILERIMDAGEFGKVALGEEIYTAAFTGTGPLCVYTPEGLADLWGRYQAMVRQEIIEIYLDYMNGFDLGSFAPREAESLGGGRYLVKATINRTGESESKTFRFYLVWKGDRFALYNAWYEDNDFAQIAGSSHRTLFERNRNDPAKSLYDRDLIKSPSDYRETLDLGETRCS